MFYSTDRKQIWSKRKKKETKKEKKDSSTDPKEVSQTLIHATSGADTSDGKCLATQRDMRHI